MWAESGLVLNCIIAENSSETSTDNAFLTWAGNVSVFSNCVGAAAVNATCYAVVHPFANAAGADFSPLVGTAAVDGGAPEAWMASASDFLGNPRVSGAAPDIGAIEYDQSGLTVGYRADVATGKAPLTVTFTVTALGAAGEISCAWDLDGDGVADKTSTGTTFVHTFADPVAVDVGLTVTDSASAQSAEAASKTRIRALGNAILVSSASPAPAEPYDNWGNAAANLPDALAIACGGSEIVVSNGTYDIAAEMQVLSDITIRGLTGDWRDVTLRSKKGSGNHRIFWLDNASARIEGMTLCDATYTDHGAGVYIGENGGALYRCAVTNCSNISAWGKCGGGVYIAPNADAALVDSCMISGCRSHHEGGAGGAALSMSAGLAVNCIITGNNMENLTGAPVNCGSVRVTGGTFAHGLVVGNKSKVCPGIYVTGGEVVNSIISDNSTQQPASYNAAWAGTGSLLKYNVMDIESPLPDTCKYEDVSATFVDYYNGDFRLKSTSEAFDGGVKRVWTKSVRDFRGRPRKSGKAPDCGIYEAGGGFSLLLR